MIPMTFIHTLAIGKIYFKGDTMSTIHKGYMIDQLGRRERVLVDNYGMVFARSRHGWVSKNFLEQWCKFVLFPKPIINYSVRNWKWSEWWRKNWNVPDWAWIYMYNESGDLA